MQPHTRLPGLLPLHLAGALPHLNPAPRLSPALTSSALPPLTLPLPLPRSRDGSIDEQEPASEDGTEWVAGRGCPGWLPERQSCLQLRTLLHATAVVGALKPAPWPLNCAMPSAHARRPRDINDTEDSEEEEYDVEEYYNVEEYCDVEELQQGSM